MSEGSGDSSRELELRIEELVRRVASLEEKVIRGGCITGCVCVPICAMVCVKAVHVEIEHLPNPGSEAGRKEGPGVAG
jgi:hypothetical protein